MKPKVYLETPIVSYLTVRPSRDLITAAHQHITQQWWHAQRARFALFVALTVMQEAQTVDPDCEQGSSLLFFTCPGCGKVIIAGDEEGTLFQNSTHMERPS